MIMKHCTNRLDHHRGTRGASFMVGWLVILGGAAAQVEMDSLIEQALDQVVNFEIVDKSLPEAFVIVADESGVPISIDPAVLKLLPYGPDTRVQEARMHNIPLRQGLGRLLSPLGLRCRVAKDRVQVEPVAALRRIGRRATWNELATLQWLAGLEWKNTSQQIDGLRERLQFQVDDPAPSGALFDAMAQAGAGSGGEVLNIACQSRGWTWYPWGKHIAVISTDEQVYRALQKPITVRAEHQPLAEVLMEIARRSGVPISFQPGVIGSLPVETQRDFSLLLVDTPAEQGLEVIAGVTGLDFRPEGNGIEIYSARTAPAQVPGRSASVSDADPIIGRVTMPGPDGTFQYEFLIRESDLPPEVKEARRKLIDEAVKAMHEHSQKGEQQ